MLKAEGLQFVITFLHLWLLLHCILPAEVCKEAERWLEGPSAVCSCIVYSYHLYLRGYAVRQKQMEALNNNPTGLQSFKQRSTQRFVTTESPYQVLLLVERAYQTLLIHYAKWALTPQYLDVKLGRRCKSHKGWLAQCFKAACSL